MTEAKARLEMPKWASTQLSELGPKSEVRTARMKLAERFERFIRRNAIAMLVVAAFALEGWAVALYTEKRVTAEVTASVTTELRAGFQRYLDQQERDAAAAQFLSGDASLQAAMEAEADALARLLYGYRNNSLRDRKTLIWCVLMRADSPAYPSSIEGVVNQAQQWMFYSDTNPIRDDDRQLAMEQLKAWHAGTYPAGLSTEFVFAEWSETDIALRNEFQTTSKTAWWRFPET